MKVTDAIKFYDGKDVVEVDKEGVAHPVTYKSVIIGAMGFPSKDETYDIKLRLYRIAEKVSTEEEPKFVAEDIVEINKRVRKAFDENTHSPLIICRIAKFLEPTSDAR